MSHDVINASIVISANAGLMQLEFIGKFVDHACSSQKAYNTAVSPALAVVRQRLL